MRGVTLDFSRPGKTTDNAFIDSLNGKFRAKCLHQLVPEPRRGARTDRSMEDRLQHRAASLGPGSLDAQDLRSASSKRPKGLMTIGPEPGARPMTNRLYSSLDERRGSSQRQYHTKLQSTCDQAAIMSATLAAARDIGPGRWVRPRLRYGARKESAANEIKVRAYSHQGHGPRAEQQAGYISATSDSAPSVAKSSGSIHMGILMAFASKRSRRMPTVCDEFLCKLPAVILVVKPQSAMPLVTYQATLSQAQ